MAVIQVIWEYYLHFLGITRFPKRLSVQIFKSSLNITKALSPRTIGMQVNFMWQNLKEKLNTVKKHSLTFEPRHEISINVVCATCKGSDQPVHTHSLIRAFAKSLECSMSVKLLTEHHLEFLSLKGGCTGSSESTLVKNATLLEITCHGSFYENLKCSKLHLL